MESVEFADEVFGVVPDLRGPQDAVPHQGIERSELGFPRPGDAKNLA